MLSYRKLSAPLSASPRASAEIFWSYTSKYGCVKGYLKQQLGRDKVLGDVLKQYFRPKDQITDAVKSLLPDGADQTLGVHIRFTDLKVPIDKVIAKVAIEMDKFQYSHVFLATDSADAEARFSQRFSNVITQTRRYCAGNEQLHSPKHYSEKVTDAEAALTDMYALSECRGLVYCSRSTFSETSRLLGDFDRDRVVDVDRYDAVIQIKRLLQEYL